MVGMVGLCIKWSVSLNEAHIIAVDHIQDIVALDVVHLAA